MTPRHQRRPGEAGLQSQRNGILYRNTAPHFFVPYAVEYFLADRRMRIGYVLGARLPVRSAGGGIGMYPWGGDGTARVDDEAPGRFYRWPDGGHVALEAVRRGDWWQLKPQPVRIAVAAFQVFHTRLGTEIDSWVTLDPGEYLQGALAQRFGARRLYIVTVSPPSEWAAATTPWPRIVRNARRDA